MNSVNKTLYIPLYGKAYVSRKKLFLDDKKAEEIWSKESFPLKGKSVSKWLAYYMGIRAAVFDDWLKEKLTATENVAVIHIGCGMDSRILRVGKENIKWYDVDFPDVIKERKLYFSETDNYKMIPCDVRNKDWLDRIPEHRHAAVVLEGVSMYMTAEELRALANDLSQHFEKVSLLADFYTVFAAKMSKYKNPVNDVDVTEVYGMDDPLTLQKGSFVLKKEHEMTPHHYTDQLSGFERFIFKKLYAGNFAKKLYKLFEYEKI